MESYKPAHFIRRCSAASCRDSTYGAVGRSSFLLRIGSDIANLVCEVDITWKRNNLGKQAKKTGRVVL